MRQPINDKGEREHGDEHAQHNICLCYRERIEAESPRVQIYKIIMREIYPFTLLANEQEDLVPAAL